MLFLRSPYDVALQFAEGVQSKDPGGHQVSLGPAGWKGVGRVERQALVG